MNLQPKVYSNGRSIFGIMPVVGTVIALRPAVGPRTAEPLVAAWLRELDAAGRSRRTLDGHRWHLLDTFAQLAADAGTDVASFDVSTVSHEQLVDYLADYRHAPDRRYTRKPDNAVRERADITMTRRTASLRTFFAWAHDRGYLVVNPAAAIALPKQRTPLPRVFEVEDALRLFDAAARSRFPERDTALVSIVLGAGPRLDELAGMRTEDLLGRPPHHIRVLGKGGKERRVPLTARAQTALDAYLAARTVRLRRWKLSTPYLWVPQRLLPHRTPGPLRLSREGVADTFDRLLTEAGIRSSGRRVHVLRGTAATALLRAGRSVREVQELLGHEQLSTTARYLLVTAEDLQATVAASPFG